MDTKKLQDIIIKGIFFIPIFSLLLFGILGLITIKISFDNYKNKEIIQYKNTIIQERKKLIKDIIQITTANIENSIKDLNNHIKEELVSRINEANNIINRVIKNNPHKSKKELKEIIKQVLSAIRFNGGRGYYFIYNKTTHIILIHPIKKFVNKDMSHFKDKRGTDITKLYDSIIHKNGQGFATIYFAKPSNPNKEFKKIVYIKYIPSLNWVIGTGEYVDDALNELKKEKLQELTSYRYGKNGYFWVHNTHYILLAHPYRTKDIGKNDENLTDIKGNKIIQLFVKTAVTKKEGFVEYYWLNPTTHKKELKISYVKYIPKFKWVIGTGIYMSDLNKLINHKTKEIKKYIDNLYLTILIVLLIGLFIIMILSLSFSTYIKSLFKEYSKDLEIQIDNAIKENREKEKLLQTQSKLAAMGEMIGAIAHQWRQPLNVLGLNTQLLIEDYLDGKIDEKYLENYEEKQMKIINFMSKTIDDFRNFFKVDKEKEKFSIKKAIEDVIEIVSAQLKNHNIEVILNGNDFEINGYPSEFKQVILNVINNAKDAILANNIQNGKIIITLKEKYISIEDNAGGIPDEIKNRIFEPYFTTKENGTGIGLYMSKQIINQMGGDIEVTNTKQGAKFIIRCKE